MLAKLPASDGRCVPGAIVPLRYASSAFMAGQTSFSSWSSWLMVAYAYQSAMNLLGESIHCVRPGAGGLESVPPWIAASCALPHVMNGSPVAVPPYRSGAFRLEASSVASADA